MLIFNITNIIIIIIIIMIMIIFNITNIIVIIITNSPPLFPLQSQSLTNSTNLRIQQIWAIWGNQVVQEISGAICCAKNETYNDNNHNDDHNNSLQIKLIIVILFQRSHYTFPGSRVSSQKVPPTVFLYPSGIDFHNLPQWRWQWCWYWKFCWCALEPSPTRGKYCK